MELRLSSIKFDADCQSRVSLDEETVAEYAYRLKEGAAFPPVVVFFDGSDHWLADGFHRYAAWKGLARERGDEATAEIPADIHQGTRVDAVRHALSANALHGKRREPGDYIKGYAIAVRCGLCAAHDVEAVRHVLACSERWARELTHAAREALDRDRAARILEARQSGATVREIAARERVSVGTVMNVQFRQPAENEHAPGPRASTVGPCHLLPRPLPAAVAALDRPSLGAWSDAIYALEKLIDALEAARPHRVPRKALPRIGELMQRATDLLTHTKLEPEHDAA